MSDNCCPVEPLRRAYSRAEAIAAARMYMVATFGQPLDMEPEERSAWYTRYGMLVDFLGDLFPAEEGKP